MSDQSKIIYVADDDAGILDSMTLMLEFAGHEVRGTLNGNDLLEEQAELPELFILDIWMSGVDGRDVCRHLKQNTHTSHIPVMLISASKDIDSTAFDAGADAFLSKPFDMDVLLDKVNLLVSKTDNNKSTSAKITDGDFHKENNDSSLLFGGEERKIG